MNNNLQKFGDILKELRIRKDLRLREVCRVVDYDPSNWSKIERGIIPAPSDEKVLCKWAFALGLSKDTKEFHEFIDRAKISQGIIPQDILAKNNIIECLPAFCRTLRSEKPTRKEIDQLIELIRNA